MTENPLALAPLNNGQAPAKRIKDASDAQKLVSALLHAGEGRSLFNYKVKGMIDGFPPRDPARLISDALSYLHNVNWLEGKARRAAALVPYYDLFSGAKYYAEVETAHGNDEHRVEWSRIITEEFHETLREYKGFDFNMQMMLCDFVTFGRGFLMFRDNKDWRFHCMPQHRVFVPDGTECFSDDLEVIVVLERVRIHRLWNNIKDRKKAREIGWSPEAVVDAIDAAVPEYRHATGQQSTWEELEQRIKDKDVSEGTGSATVPQAHIYVRELSTGRITHQIIDLNQRNIGDKPKGFLFEKRNRYGSFNQCLSTFFLETEDGSWNGARGLGNDLYASIQAKNNLKNSAMDMTRMRTTVMLQAKTPGAFQNASNIAVGGVMTIIPPDFDVQQSTMLGDVESPMKMDRALDIMLDSNTGTYRQRNTKEGGNPPTAEQVRLDYSQTAVLSNSAVNRFYGCLDPHYKEVYRRMSSPNQVGDDEGSRMARGFQKRCRDRGVPQLALMKVRSVRAYRNAGNGSVFMRQQVIQSTKEIMPMFPEQGRRHWLEDAVSILGNQTMAGRWLPEPPMPGNAEDHAATAALENGVMKNGAPVMRTKTQNDMIHLAAHLDAMESAAGTVAQTDGQSAPDVLGFLSTVGPHAMTHLQALSSDPTRKEAVAEAQKRLQDLEKLAGDLRKHLEQQAKQRQEQAQAQQKAQAINNGTDPETMIHAAQAKSDAELKQFKAQHAAQIKEQKTRHDMALKEATTRQGLALADATTASDIRRKDAMAESTQE